MKEGLKIEALAEIAMWENTREIKLHSGKWSHIKIMKDLLARIEELEAQLLNLSNSTGFQPTEAEIEAAAKVRFNNG